MYQENQDPGGDRCAANADDRAHSDTRPGNGGKKKDLVSRDAGSGCEGGYCRPGSQRAYADKFATVSSQNGKG
jgi:hypothetical protein